MANEGLVRVLVVDDHVAIRTGIASLIDSESPRLQAVGTAASADEALDQARSLQPNVVVLDVNLSGEDGLALIPALRHAAPCAVVVLSSLVDSNLAEHAKRLGAQACLHKTAPGAELLRCIWVAGTPDLQQSDTASGLGLKNQGSSMSNEINTAMAAARDFVVRDDAVTAIEYGLLAALIALAAIAAFSATGDSLSGMYVNWTNAVLAAL